ncbi:MAG: MFS transporter [Spirochaetia bacterium]
MRRPTFLEDIAPETWRFSTLMVFFWAGIVTLEAFLVPYLISIGLGSGAAGLVMSSVFFAGIVTAPLWAAVCDATDRHRRVVLIALGISLVAVLLIPLVAPVLVPVLLLGLVYSATGNSMPAILDSWIMRRRIEEPDLEYGIARGFGAAGFALGGILLGRLSDVFGPWVLFPMYALFILISIVMILRLPAGGNRMAPATPGAPAATDAPAASGAPATPRAPVYAEVDRPVSSGRIRLTADVVRAIFSSGPYLVFLAIALLIFIQLRAALTFLPLLIYETGGTNIHVGLAQTLSAGSEVPFMFAAAFLLRRFKPRAMLLFAMGIFIFRIGLMGWVYSPVGLVALQLMHGLSFGVFLPVSVHFIDRIAPRKYSSIFQTLAPSIYFGLGSVIGSSLGGTIIEHMGLRTMYQMLWIPVTAAAALFALYLLLQPTRKA